jgi:hypothetical protein
MAIGATDIALGDLEENPMPPLVCGEDDHVVTLGGWIAMIEVEYDDVGLAAVDAGMSPKVLTN